MTLRRTALVVLAALALSLFLAAAAEASGRHWHTMVSNRGAHLQACKVPTTANGPWKIFVRVNAQHATAPTRGNAGGERGTTPIGTSWDSGRVARGTTSAVGFIKVPRGARNSVTFGLSSFRSDAIAGMTEAGVGRC